MHTEEFKNLKLSKEYKDKLPIHLANLSGEPSGNGYSRQPVSSTTGFTIINNGGVYQARSNVVIFAAVTGSWGPVVQHIFNKF